MIPLPEVTRQLFDAFQPTLVELRAAVSQRPDFSIVCSGILEDGPTAAWMSLSCERTDGTLPEIILSITCTLMRAPGATRTTIRASVGWFRSAALGGSDGFSIYEAMTPAVDYSDASSITTLARRFPELRSIFLRALGRGRLPSRLRVLWQRLFHGCPAPQHFTLNDQ